MYLIFIYVILYKWLLFIDNSQYLIININFYLQLKVIKINIKNKSIDILKILDYINQIE